MNSIYVIDTSAWIDLFQKYPKNVFASLWKNIESLIQKKIILSPEQVFKEVQSADDDITKWCKKHSKMFLDNTSTVIIYATEIIKKHSGLVDPYSTREIADPFLIALARSLKSNLTNSIPIIVTQESENSSKKIPFVSRDYGLTSINLIGMFQAEKWTF